MSAKTLFHFDTELTADTVEWCPAVHREGIAACGTYQLDAATGKRRGSLSLHNLTKNRQSFNSKTLQREYGILDMKWAVHSGGTVLALATSRGDVVFVSLLTSDVEREWWSLEDLGRVAVCSGDGKLELCLSLDWSRDSQCHNMVAVSDSLGAVSVVTFEGGGGGGGKVIERWQAHEFEAWIVCFGHQTHMVYSGGDDCRLCVWDTRTKTTRPAAVMKEHTMGVCSLQCHPSEEHLLASGSYDERVLVWDVRSLKKPFKETAVGGGVWRVKWHPTNSDLVATACMHNGFSIINWHLKNAVEAETVCEYKEHGSLTYGIDWSRMESKDSTPTQHLLASCSFYDHSLHFWTVTL